MEARELEPGTFPWVVFSLPGADGSVCPSGVEEAGVSVTSDSVVQGEKEVCDRGLFQ